MGWLRSDLNDYGRKKIFDLDSPENDPYIYIDIYQLHQIHELTVVKDQNETPWLLEVTITP